MYEGTTRTVEPFTLGCLKTTGHLTLVAYCLKNSKPDKTLPGWRKYTVSKITAIQILNTGILLSREGYKNPSSEMKSPIIDTI